MVNRQNILRLIALAAAVRGSIDGIRESSRNPIDIPGADWNVSDYHSALQLYGAFQVNRPLLNQLSEAYQAAGRRMKASQVRERIARESSLSDTLKENIDSYLARVVGKSS